MLSTIVRRIHIVPLGVAMLMAALSFEFSIAHAEETNVVVVKNFAFSPTSLTVKAGSTVIWKNLDGEPHTVVNDAGLFHSSALDQNDTYKFRFDKPGVYKIFCGIHPHMKATIIVQ